MTKPPTHANGGPPSPACIVPGCTVLLERFALMCERHWARVSPATRSRLARYGRPNPLAAHLSDEYLAAVRTAQAEAGPPSPPGSYDARVVKRFVTVHVVDKGHCALSCPYLIRPKTERVPHGCSLFEHDLAWDAAVGAPMRRHACEVDDVSDELRGERR
jgi:hypothetical protein